MQKEDDDDSDLFTISGYVLVFVLELQKLNI